jgi:tetratricopeptide (TPR) repeat protein
MDEWLELSTLVDQVQEYLDLGLYDQAVALLDEYKDIYSTEWEIYFLYSRASSEQNKPNEAITSLRQGLKFDKDNADCLLGLFYCYAQLDQLSRGGRYLFRAIRLYPENDLIVNAMLWYHVESNAFDKAVSFYEKNRSLLENNPESLRNVGVAYERAGNFEKAKECFTSALEINPDFDEVRDMLADHYLMIGQTDKSLELYTEFLKRSSKNIRAMSRLVFFLSQSQHLEEAEKKAMEIISIYPNSPAGYVDLAYVYINTNKHQKAIETADKALDVAPLDAEALRVKGIAYSETGKNPEAEQMFKKAMSLAPDNPEILRDYYTHLRNAGNHRKMEKMVLRVIRQEYPYCIEDYWFLADYYREKEQNLKAFHYLTKAYRIMPGEKDLIPPMVEILLDMGHIYYAIPIMKQYIETKGWDDIMTELADHRKLQNKWSKEGIRFLRFYGEKVVDFRKFIFAVYIRKFVILSFYLTSAMLLSLSYIFTGYKGLILIFIFLGGFTGTLLVYHFIKQKFLNKVK